MHHTHSGRGRPRLNTDLGLMHGSESAFGSDEEFHQVELSIANELVEVIPADAAHDLGKPAIDLVSIGAHNIENASFQTAARRSLFKLHLAEPPALT